MQLTENPGRRIENVLLVYKKSQLALYVHERKNARYQALMDAGDEVIASMEAAHQTHEETLKRVKDSLAQAGLRVRTCYRARVARQTEKTDLVVTVGGDGTLLDASHKVSAAAVLGVNSDPERSVGFLCAANADNFADTLDDVRRGRLPAAEVPRLFGHVDGEALPFPILNEVLVAPKNPAATARYILEHDDVVEEQRSAGVWLAAPAGSSGAIATAGGSVFSLGPDAPLQFAVREPSASSIRPLTLLRGNLAPRGVLVVKSKMRQGMLYLDGAHHRVAFPVGATFTVGRHDMPLRMIVTPQMAERRLQLASRLQQEARS